MSFHTSLLFWFQIWKTWIADGVCGCSGPFWIWTLACNKPISTKTTWSTETEAALFRLSLWDRCSHEEWDWMRMWGAFAVDGPLLKYVWKYIAIVGCVLSPACYFWHQIERRCVETRDVPLAGHQWAGRRLASMSLFFLTWSTSWAVGPSCSAEFYYRHSLVHHETVIELHRMNPRDGVRQLTPSLNLCLVKAFFNVY